MDAIYDVPKNGTERTWALIRQVSLLSNRLLERRLLKLGLTPEKVMTLQACSRGKVIPAKVARMLCLTEQTITGMVNRMEVVGLIRRIPKKKGRPFTTLVLTEKGEKAGEAGWAITCGVLKNVEHGVAAAEGLTVDERLSVLRDRLAEELHIEVLERPEDD